MKALIIIAAFLSIVPARAQEFVPPDKELWDTLSRELGNVNMTLTAHQQVQQLLQSIQREAQMRAARASITRQNEKKEVP